MPFKSEKQRRFLWAEHPELAKRWAHEYPESNKGLPMYAHKKEKEAEARFKGSVLDVLGNVLAKTAAFDFVNASVTQTLVSTKVANSGMVRVDIPHSDKPTYAGQERADGEVKSDENLDCAARAKKDDEKAVTAIFGKLALVLAQPLREEIERRKAEEEGRDPLYVPENLNVRRFALQSPAITPPIGLVPPPGTTPPGVLPPTHGQAIASAGPVGGGSNPQFNPINSFGALGASGQLNGNAAFGIKNSPNSSKIAAVACSCGCGDTVTTCKCGPDCSCRKPGGSCYKSEKQAVGAATARLVANNAEEQGADSTTAAILGLLAAGGLAGAYHGGNYLLSSGAKRRKPNNASAKQAASSPAWQRSEGKNPEGGLNAKGRASYKAETGGTLKAPVTESNPSGERAKRQNSFCSRMCGMKSENTGADTAKDPDSRINKSLRKWNCKCSSALEFGFKLATVLPNELKNNTDWRTGYGSGLDAANNHYGYNMARGALTGAALAMVHDALRAETEDDKQKTRLQKTLQNLGWGLGGAALGAGIRGGLSTLWAPSSKTASKDINQKQKQTQKQAVLDTTLEREHWVPEVPQEEGASSPDFAELLAAYPEDAPIELTPLAALLGTGALAYPYLFGGRREPNQENRPYFKVSAARAFGEKLAETPSRGVLMGAPRPKPETGIDFGQIIMQSAMKGLRPPKPAPKQPSRLTNAIFDRILPPVSTPATSPATVSTLSAR